MPAKPDAAWFGATRLDGLTRVVTDQCPPESADRLWNALTPLLVLEPADIPTWKQAIRDTLLVQSFGSALIDALVDKAQGAAQDYYWQQLKEALAAGWPKAPNPLTDNDAICRIRQLAQKAIPDGRGKQDAIEGAPATLLFAFQKFDRTRRFNPWARSVLHHDAVDQIRRAVRVHLHDGLDSRTASESPSTWEEIAERLGATRRLLDEAMFFPDSAAGVDYYAAFVLEMQLRLAERLSDHTDEPLHQLLGRLLPWRPWEQPRRIKPGWPTLAQLWLWLRDHQLLPPHPGRSEALTQALSGLAGESKCCLSATWNKWVNRAKDRLQRSLRPRQWAESFGTLFPDRQEDYP